MRLSLQSDRRRRHILESLRTMRPLESARSSESGPMRIKTVAHGIALHPTRTARIIATKTLPSWSLINYAFTAPRFYRTHGYLPRLPSNQSATLNDYIYHRMIRGGWTDLERRATDKEIAKSVASELCPTIRTARIVRTIDHTKMTEAEFREEISPFYGQRVVAKSTHGCGDIVFLQDKPDDAAVTALYRTRGWNPYYEIRAEVYRKLARKVIIEEQLPDGESDDYKFICAGGKVIFCQLDQNRFTKPTKTYLTPDFKIIPEKWGTATPNKTVTPPSELPQLLRVARQLSEPFEFVRIDLYNTRNGIFLGEFTFTPGGAFEVFGRHEFGVKLLSEVRAAIERRQPVNIRRPVLQTS